MPDHLAGDRRLRIVDGTTLAGNAVAVLEALDSVRIVVRPVAGSAAAVVAVGLLARLFAHVDIDGDIAVDLPGQPPTLTAVLRRLVWVRPIPSTQPTRDCVVAIGAAQGQVDWGVGGDEWTVRVGRSSQPVDDRSNGATFGAQMAAALVVSELVKTALEPLGWVSNQLTGDLVWNLLDYQHRPASQMDSHPVSSGLVAQPSLAFGGIGSIGTSAVRALSWAGSVGAKTISLVDDESFDDRNPFRYPALDEVHSGMAKVDWAAQQLTHLRGSDSRAGNDADLVIDRHHGDLRSWILSREQPGYRGLMIASPDTVAGRRDVADLLPQEAITVGVAGLALHVSRHHLGDNFACPYCQCVPLGPPSTQAEIHAEQTGLDVVRVLQLQTPGAVLTDHDVAAVRAAGRLPQSGGAGLLGRPLAELVVRAYAELAIPGPATGGTSGATPMLAAPHVSLVGGLLAAAEARKYLLGLPRIDRRVDLDLTGLPSGTTRRPPADSTGRCLCASPFRQRWMQQLYQ